MSKLWEWSDEQKARFRARMIEKYGTEEAWRKALSDNAKKPRKRKKKTD